MQVHAFECKEVEHANVNANLCTYIKIGVAFDVGFNRLAAVFTGNKTKLKMQYRDETTLVRAWF